jgi:hypothetical protein
MKKKYTCSDYGHSKTNCKNPAERWVIGLVKKQRPSEQQRDDNPGPEKESLKPFPEGWV